MYHFVRDLYHSRYPEIKGLQLSHFKEQLGYIEKHYTVIRMAELIAAAYSADHRLPQNAALLTFDDGYIDHYTNVFPILDEKGIQGCFFPPAKAIKECQVLDVNKIHFVLASVSNKAKIIQYIFSMLDEARAEYSLKENELYYNTLAASNRFDTGEVVFIKSILQRELPEKLRREIVNNLFRKYVTEDEGSFARELYMSVDQLKCMVRNGMYVGSHGYDHYWLDTLDKDNQEKEVDLSLEFLKEIGCSRDSWVMCYPYGAYNDSLLSILKKKGCKAGLTTRVGIADLNSGHPLTMPRLDTNDLPKERDSLPNAWTSKVLEDKTYF